MCCKKSWIVLQLRTLANTFIGALSAICNQIFFVGSSRNSESDKNRNNAKKNNTTTHRCTCAHGHFMIWFVFNEPQNLAVFCFSVALFELMGPRWKCSWISTTVKDQESSIKFIFFNFCCFFLLSCGFVYFEHWCISISIFISIYISMPHMLAIWIQRMRCIFWLKWLSCQPFGDDYTIAFWWHTAVQSMDFVWSLASSVFCVPERFNHILFGFWWRKMIKCVVEILARAANFFLLFKDTAQWNTFMCILILRMKLQTINPKMMERHNTIQKIIIIILFCVVVWIDENIWRGKKKNAKYTNTRYKHFRIESGQNK